MSNEFHEKHSLLEIDYSLVVFPLMKQLFQG